MNDKGVIFTIDAVLALAIFIGSTIVMYSFFIDDAGFGVLGVNIYSQGDNLLEIADNSGIFSTIFLLNQVGETEEAAAWMEAVQSMIFYPLNIYVYEWNGETLEPVISSPSNQFKEFYTVSRHVIFSLDRGIESLGTNTFVAVESGLPGESISSKVIVENPTESDWTLSIEPSILDWENFPVDMEITPALLSVTAPPGTSEFEFNVSISQDALTEQHLFYVEISGDINEISGSPFNVFKLGLVKLEVGGEM